jgi:hypothetical protein
MQGNNKPVIQPASVRRLPKVAFENTDTPLHQLLDVLQEVHDENDDTIRVKLSDVLPSPSASGLHRMKLDELMRNVNTRIMRGEIDSARSLYHYFVGDFYQEMRPNLNLPPLSIYQPHLDLPQQDLLVTIINSAKIAEEYHDTRLNKGWDNLDDTVRKEIIEPAVVSLANVELIKLGLIRLNQLENLITDTGAWQDGSGSRRHIWNQAEVDEAVAIVAKRDDHISLLMRFEYFLKRCYPSVTVPNWKKPSKITMMTEEEILAELYSDFRNDYIIVSGIRGIVSIAKQRPVTLEEAIAQVDRLWKPYGVKLQEIVETHVNPNDPPDEKLQQIRLAVTTAYQNALQEKNIDQIELLWDLVKIMRRSDLSWEDVEQKSVGA